MAKHFVPCVIGEIWDGTNVEAIANVAQSADPNAIIRRNPDNGTELQYVNGDDTVVYTFKYGDGYLTGHGFVSANDLAGLWREI